MEKTNPNEDELKVEDPRFETSKLSLFVSGLKNELILKKVIQWKINQKEGEDTKNQLKLGSFVFNKGEKIKYERETEKRKKNK